jgi:GTP-binding protein
MTRPFTPRREAADAVTGAARAGRAARDWMHGARFLTTASTLDQLPAAGRPEIAFVGRSNAGKSSAINCLARRRRLAFASRTPGRTQHINLFELGPRDAPDARLADLPGYGYAAVDRGVKLRWQAVMADYLARREGLSGVVLLVDVRIGFTDLDRRLLALLAPRLSAQGVRLLVLLTKCDKLSRQAGRAALRGAVAELEALLPPSADAAATLFSALDDTGADDVAATLRCWVDGAGGAAGDEPAAPAE